MTRKYSYSDLGYEAMREAANRGRQKRSLEANARREEYSQNPSTCLGCGAPIEYNKRLINKYCSISCSTKHLNSRRGRNKTNKQENCKYCDKPLTSGRKFCSNKCQQNLKRDTLIKQWLSGEINPSTQLGCSITLRKYLLEECNHKCPKCGWCEINPTTGKIPLEINHIDGDHTNNSRENLEVLCPNCHSLTPNFRALNKKSTRTHR
jgi:predicted nucleic acid-binding Zn ribbon protein